MSTNIKLTVEAIRCADKALKAMVKEDTEKYKAKGETMFEQIGNYIMDKLDACDWICDDVQTRSDYYKTLYLRVGPMGFTLHIGTTGISIAANKGSKTLFIEHGKIDTEKQAMEFVAEEWGAFKLMLDKSIESAMAAKIEKMCQIVERTELQNAIINTWEL